MVAVETKKIGGSLMVRIPKALANEQHLSEGDIVELAVHKVKKDWFGAFPQLRPLEKEERFWNEKDSP